MNYQNGEQTGWQRRYLLPDRDIDSADPCILAAVQELTRNCRTDKEKASSIFYFVRDKITYNMYPKNTRRGGYCASFVLQQKEGWCLQKSILAAALFRASGIPARLCFAELINHALNRKSYEAIGTNHFSPHTYVEIYLGENWIPVTPVFPEDLCRRLQVPAVEFDGVHPAMLSSVDLAGGPYMEYISKSPGCDVVPWERIIQESKRVYGEKSTLWFSEDFMKEL